MIGQVFLPGTRGDTRLDGIDSAPNQLPRGQSVIAVIVTCNVSIIMIRMVVLLKKVAHNYPHSLPPK